MSVDFLPDLGHTWFSPVVRFSTFFYILSSYIRGLKIQSPGKSVVGFSLQDATNASFDFDN